MFGWGLDCEWTRVGVTRLGWDVTVVTAAFSSWGAKTSLGRSSEWGDKITTATLAYMGGAQQHPFQFSTFRRPLSISANVHNISVKSKNG